MHGRQEVRITGISEEKGRSELGSGRHSVLPAPMLAVEPVSELSTGSGRSRPDLELQRRRRKTEACPNPERPFSDQFMAHQTSGRRWTTPTIDTLQTHPAQGWSSMRSRWAHFGCSRNLGHALAKLGPLQTPCLGQSLSHVWPKFGPDSAEKAPMFGPNPSPMWSAPAGPISPERFSPSASRAARQAPPQVGSPTSSSTRPGRRRSRRRSWRSRCGSRWPGGRSSWAALRQAIGSPEPGPPDGHQLGRRPRTPDRPWIALRCAPQIFAPHRPQLALRSLCTVCRNTHVHTRSPLAVGLDLAFVSTSAGG